MALNNISVLADKTQYHIEKFLSNCTIEEKIDSHYMYFTIVGKDNIKFYKGSQKEISRVDLILNNMWNQFILDWTYIMYKNHDWFNSHIGYTFYMFYLPCSKPLSTEYNISKPTYIIDRILYQGKQQSIKSCISQLTIDSDKYDFKIKKYLKKNIIDFNNYTYPTNETHDEKLNYIQDIIKDLIVYSDDDILALNQPEGIIYRWNNKSYQVNYTEKQHIEVERTSYEFVLCDFLKYIKSINYSEYVVTKYVKTVCNLFNMYIINNESIYNTVKNNVDVNSLNPPIYGHGFDITLTYIPDAITRQFVETNELYKNIFKILLVNLSKEKYSKHLIYMDDKRKKEWNSIVKYLRLVTKYE